MMDTRRRKLLGMGAAVCLAPSLVMAEEEMDTGGSPGLVTGIVRAGQPSVLRAHGFADVAAGKRVTTDTAFHIASVSKVVTGTVMMMLLEDGGFALDDPIAGVLDFPVAHPRFPATPITFRHLFNHTSGISDALYWKVAAFRDGGIGLREFLVGYLTPDGRWYVADDACSAAQPGARRDYSDVGIALLGYLASRVGRKSALDTVSRQRLFAPLGMRHTAWQLAELNDVEVAQPYSIDGGTPQRLPPAAYPDWPAGLLRTSAHDFAQFVQMLCERGTVSGTRYLQPGTLEQMFVPQPVGVDEHIQQGLIWELRSRDDVHLATHFGSDPGAASFVCLDLDKRLGVFAFANVRGDDKFMQVQKRMLTGLLRQARA